MLQQCDECPNEEDIENYLINIFNEYNMDDDDQISGGFRGGLGGLEPQSDF